MCSLTFLKSFSKPGLSKRSSSWNSTLVSRNFSILRILSGAPPSPRLRTGSRARERTKKTPRQIQTQNMNTNPLNKHSEQAGSLFSVRGFTSHSVTEVVYHHRLVTCFNEFHHTVAPNVASSACDQHLLCHCQNLAGTTQTHTESTPHSAFWWSYLILVGKLWILIATQAARPQTNARDVPSRNRISSRLNSTEHTWNSCWQMPDLPTYCPTSASQHHQY